MTKKMLIDATHPEETRVAVVDGTRLEEFDFEIAARRQIKSNIYLAKVTRVEPSLQAAFVEYGGNRHGFLPFPEIHPDYYRIPVGDRSEHDYEPDERPRPRNVEIEAKPAEAPEDAHTESVEHTDTVEAAPSEPEDEPAADNESWTRAEATGAVDTTVFSSASDEEADIGDDTARGREESGDDVTHDEANGSNAAEPHEEPAFATSESDRGQGDNGAETVEIVGGDEVEEAQRRRRSQMPHYKIQEVIKRRQIMLVQVSKEERGNKGAAVTTFLSLPGRYCVLMPNTSRGGGVSRKIANPADRKRMKELISDLEVPDGMSVILRTAGVERTKAEIKRDLEYLLRLWENIRALTLESTAPALIYEEGNLVKRAIRDLYTRDIESIEIAGEEGYRQAKDFMRMLMPSHAKRVQPYRDPAVPLFHRYQVESQIDLINNPVAHLRSGGYIVINQTEALVSIDVNSGRSTRERNIEETAVKTNLEAADEIARQLRLRDMGGLIVIDFIDMEEPRHDGQVERRLKEAMKNDRARIQLGRISPFGLLELSRQRMHPSLVETNFHTCPHCLGTGLIRSIESAALLVLRAIEDEGIKRRSAELQVTVAGNIALYILNQKRATLTEIEQRYGFSVRVLADDSLIAPEHRIERLKAKAPGAELPAPLNLTGAMAAVEAYADDEDEDEDETEETQSADSARVARTEGAAADGAGPGGEEPRRKRRRNRRRRGRDGRDDGPRTEQPYAAAAEPRATEAIDDAEPGEDEDEAEAPALSFSAPRETDSSAEAAGRRRRRGRRGGRGRTRRNEDGRVGALPPVDGEDQPESAQDEVAQPEMRTDAGAFLTPAETESFEVEPAVPAEDVAEPKAEWEAAVAAPIKAPRARRSRSKAQAAPELDAPVEPSESAAHVEPVAHTALNGASEGAHFEPQAAEPESAEPETPVARAFETVNEPPPAPRRGWWKRLTE